VFACYCGEFVDPLSYCFMAAFNTYGFGALIICLRLIRDRGVLPQVLHYMGVAILNTRGQEQAVLQEAANPYTNVIFSLMR